jgi:hypothetical protein
MPAQSSLSFPPNPSLNQVYTFGEKSWRWNGYAWELTTIQRNPMNPIVASIIFGKF